MRWRSALGKQFVRDRRPICRAVNGPNFRVSSGRAVRYQLAAALSSRKAVGEADSFPYRLIANHLFTSATTYGRGAGVGRGRGDGV